MMTHEDKERDEALIVEAERLATKATQSTTKSLAWIEECQSALIHLVRSNWQPAPKPDRAEVLFDELYGKTKDEQIDCFCRHFAELRAEWEAERLEIPPHKHYSTPLIERLNGPHEWGYRDPVEGGFIADMSPFEASDRLSELEAERPAVVVPFGDDVIAAARFYADVPVAESRIVIMANAILDGAKGGE